MSGRTYRRPTTCGYRIGLRPLGGACPLRPLRLLWISVSAAGGGPPPQQAILVPNGAQTAVPSKTSNKKNTPQLRARYFCGAPCGSKPEHFCLSGRHRHHTTAHPEVMLLFLRARIKRGVEISKGLLRHILALQTGLRYSTVPLTFPHSSFFWLIAEQPTSPYPDWIT